jgi:NTP pyrophosphatase (non-canonical NTP hydrolase)
VKPLDLETIAAHLSEFAADRDWNQFHTPKNLAMAIAAEVGELVEVFQWLTEDESLHLTVEQRATATDEIMDVLIYLVRLGDVLEVDWADAFADKIRRNADRYPAEDVRGSAEKRSR